MPVGGNPNRFRWSTRYVDLAAMEVDTTKKNGGTSNFLAGSIRNSIWRTV